MEQKLDLAKKEAQQLSTKLKQAESENKKIGEENDELRAKQSEHTKTVAALKNSDAEIGE